MSIVFNKEDSYPSLEFSGVCGLKLYTDWIIPFNIKWFYFFYFIMYDIPYCSWLQKRLVTYRYKQLVKVNPQLACINVIIGCPEDVIFGAISKFNYDDIKHFVETYEAIKEYNLSSKPIYDLLEKQFSVRPEWVISPNTMKMLLDKLEFKV